MVRRKTRPPSLRRRLLPACLVPRRSNDAKTSLPPAAPLQAVLPETSPCSHPQCAGNAEGRAARSMPRYLVSEERNLQAIAPSPAPSSRIVRSRHGEAVNSPAIHLQFPISRLIKRSSFRLRIALSSSTESPSRISGTTSRFSTSRVSCHHPLHVARVGLNYPHVHTRRESRLHQR